MKKILFLGLLIVPLGACSGGKNLKISDVSKMNLDEMVEVTASLTPEQAQRVGQAVGQCQANPEAEICGKTIKSVIK
ncbi:hypothetical protein GKC56_05425 [Neisseriaceae bacterium PsAf]|nr:hypothetical protein [Neisseriaceae bacterium PsAf]MCV2503054.1 hypothetical protein [Neisseriaceae bacterium]